MSDESQTRTTSHAKSVDLEQQKTALDRAQPIAPAFERAKAEQESSLEQQKAAPPGPANPQHAPSPTLDLKPQGQVRMQVDRQIDNEKRQQQIARAKALNDAVLQQQRERDKDKDLERDKGERSR